MFASLCKVPHTCSRQGVGASESPSSQETLTESDGNVEAMI